ncbi:hypothetical protein SAMN03159294_1746 [Kosakonia radicincitans]|nr:hypothetical protein SAMN03159294_1746 [Kosakonia radicincitans]
MADNGDEY